MVKRWKEDFGEVEETRNNEENRWKFELEFPARVVR
jgi:hypothetical protein